MQPEEVIAALRFEPLLPLWLIAGLGALALLVVALAACRGAPAARSGGLPPSPCCCCGWRARAWCRKPATTCPTSACWWSTSRPRCRSASARGWPKRRARRSTQQAAKLPDLELRTVTVPEGGDAGTRLFAAIDRALADIPRSRLAGTIAITDGQVHDIPDTAPGGAPLNVLIPAKGRRPTAACA